jgi:hypothetical protein
MAHTHEDQPSGVLATSPTGTVRQSLAERGMWVGPWYDFAAS